MIDRMNFIRTCIMEELTRKIDTKLELLEDLCEFRELKSMLEGKKQRLLDRLENIREPLEPGEYKEILLNIYE